MKIVEFMGPPGSGKSTLSPSCIKFMRRNNHRVITVKEADIESVKKESNRILLNFIFRYFPRSLSFKISSYLNKTTNLQEKYEINSKNVYSEIYKFTQSLKSQREISKSHKKRIDNWFSGLLGRYHFLNTNLDKNQCVVFDSGFMQMASSLFVPFEDTFDYKLLEKYILHIPEIELLFHIDISDDVCLQRLKSKGTHIRTRGKSDSEILEFISQTKKILEASLEIYCGLNPNTRIINIDNNDTLSSSINQAEKELITQHGVQ